MEHWIAEAVIYQINLRAIAARDPRNPLEAANEREDDPRSPLAYLADHLDALRELGITVLHLMPIFRMGEEGRKGIGSPYAVKDFRSIDPEYGTPEEFAALLREAHDRGFKVIIGMVPNHTSRDHIWTESHPDFYVRRGDGLPFFDLDWSDTAKLDYRNQALCREMIEVYDYWLTFPGGQADGGAGVDGFRLDMAHFINDRGFWNIAIAELQERHPNREILFLAECYGFKNNLDLFARGLPAAYDDEFYKCMEYFYGRDEDGHSLLLRPTYPARHNRDFHDKYAAFRHHGIAAAFTEVLLHGERLEAGPAGRPRLARYTDNHDEGRGAYRYGDEATRAFNELIFCSPDCIPFLLAGQEFGAMNRPSIHERIRPCDKGHRTQVGKRVLYEDGVEFEGNLFARGRSARQAWHGFYQRLIRLRREHPALIHGAFELLDPGEQVRKRKRQVVGFAREWNGRRYHFAINLGHEPRRLRHTEWFRGKTLYGDLENDALPPFRSILVQTS